MTRLVLARVELLEEDSQRTDCDVCHQAATFMDPYWKHQHLSRGSNGGQFISFVIARGKSGLESISIG